MSEPRSKRVAISLTQQEHTALQTIAQRQRVPLAQLIAQITQSHLATEHAEPPGHPEAPAPDDGWARDAAVRDPRIELAFAGALGDFASYLRERPRTSAHRRR